MTTSEKVRALIQKSGVSQRAFAESVGIHPVSMSNYLKKDSFSMRALNKIAEGQGVSVSSLLPDKKKAKQTKDPQPTLNGYIEYEGKIEAVRSVEDLRALLERISPSVKPISKSANKQGEEPHKQEKGEREKPRYNIKCSDEGYAYFFMDVPLSNWWDSVPAIQYDGHSFNSSESVFMYLKALFFDDEETAARIVQADNKTYAQPKSRWNAVKKLGNKVKNLDNKKWAGPNRKAMAIALKQKALYDEEFKRVLLDPQYAGMTFCEAAPKDTIWGIGLDMRTAMRVGRGGWQGHNFLGRALTDLRNELRPDLAKVEKIR